MGWLIYSVFPIALVVFFGWIAWETRSRRRKRALHAALFRPKIEIHCHNSPAEAGSSRTPGSLARSDT